MDCFPSSSGRYADAIRTADEMQVRVEGREASPKWNDKSKETAKNPLGVQHLNIIIRGVERKAVSLHSKLWVVQSTNVRNKCGKEKLCFIGMGNFITVIKLIICEVLRHD